MRVVYISLERDVEEAINYLSLKDKVREEAIKASREILRYSTEATRLVHAGLFEEALSNIRKASEVYSRTMAQLAEHPDIMYSGILLGSVVEFVEAYVTYYIIREGRIPSRREIGVDPVSYLLGLGDVVGELKRHVLDLLLKNRVEEAEKIAAVMNDIYNNLRQVNFPDALLPGFRHKVDTARRLVESALELIIYSKNTQMIARRVTGG
jgi:translin